MHPRAHAKRCARPCWARAQHGPLQRKLDRIARIPPTPPGWLAFGVADRQKHDDHDEYEAEIRERMVACIEQRNRANDGRKPQRKNGPPLPGQRRAPAQTIALRGKPVALVRHSTFVGFAI